MAKLNDPKLTAEYEVKHLVSFFEQTGNVAAAWRCWHIARKLGLDVPGVILAEIDRFAAAISEVVDHKSARLDAKTIAAAWGTAARGVDDPATALRMWGRDLDIAVAVFMKIGSKTKSMSKTKSKPMSAPKAYKEVASEVSANGHLMSPENVKRVYAKHRTEIRAATKSEESNRGS